MSASFSASISRCSGSGRRAAPDVITPTHAYPAQEGSPPPEPLRQEQFPWIAYGRCWPAAWSCFSSLEELAGGGRRRPGVLPPSRHQVEPVPAALGGGRAARRRPGASIPLRAERDWPDALVKRLQLVAQVFTNALARRRADEALRESEERLSLAADSAEAGLWVLDYRDGRLLGHGEGPGDLRVLAGRGRHHGASSRRRSIPTTGTSFGAPSSGPRARANPSTWSTGSSAGRRQRALDRVPRAAPASTPPASRSA